MKNWWIVGGLVGVLFSCQSTPSLETLAAEAQAKAGAEAAVPDPLAEARLARKFADVMVHDPSVIVAEGEYWVFGSHLQAARSQDLLRWTQVSTGPEEGNPLVPHPSRDMAQALTWAQTTTFWAPDVIQLRADKKFYLYYCACKGDRPLAALGMAVADKVEGPYRNLGLLLRSGMEDEPAADGRNYESSYHPNTVDPNVFYDQSGKLWMVYGSYSGGIFLLSLDPATGRPFPGQGYGKKLAGGNNVRIEAPYMLYSPDTGYYYLFLSFGGLGSDGGYNLRVARAKTPEGPFLDPLGQDLIRAKGLPNSVFDDDSIAPFGEKLIGGYQFTRLPGEKGIRPTGYLSPGHNSALYDPTLKKYFLFFHTRFENRGEAHQLRVHQFTFNAEGWPILVPFRYTGETFRPVAAEAVAGTYKVVNHGKDISAEVKRAVGLTLNADGTVTGAQEGTWSLTGDHSLVLVLGTQTYRGEAIVAWESDEKREVMTFTALSSDGTALWGSRAK